MSMNFSKNKEKRSRSSPSEANNSFVKNVTSRVSGLLPATIAKWFSPSSSYANGSAQSGDATDSSTEDEGLESPIVTQPPAKRMRLQGGGYKINHYVTTDANCVTSNIDTLESCTPYNTIQSLPGRTIFSHETNFVSTPLRSSSDDSPLSRVDQNRTDSTLIKTQLTMSAIGPSVSGKRKSLFVSPSNNEASNKACTKTACNSIRDLKQPCFKPSFLGSPFYPGRTMYGGAATSYMNQPNIKQRKNTLVNESNSTDNTISHSARRIMDLLEHYSSPLDEAKRIHIVSTTKKDNFNSSYFINSNVPKVSYKTQELHVPSIASILRLKQRSRLMDTTSAARQIIASHSSTMEYTPYPSVSTPQSNTCNDDDDSQTSNKKKKYTGKVKSRLLRRNRGDNTDLETNLSAPVELPDAVLRIDQSNLPKFSFGWPALRSNSSLPPNPTFTLTSPSFTARITETPSRKPKTVVPVINSYNFSSPDRISTEPPVTKTTPPKFTFGSPERRVDQIEMNEKKDNDSSNVVGASKEIRSQKSKDWQCSDCWVFNKPDIDKCICCEGKKPSNDENVAKSTMCNLADRQKDEDKCVNCEKVHNNIDITLVTKPVASSQWKCDDCWVSNEESADKCVCCAAINTKKPTTKLNFVANHMDNTLKCDNCWIKNKNSVEKCIACVATKPGAKPSTFAAPPTGFFSTPSKPPDDTFKIMIKKQTDKWECSSCLVRNANDRTICSCCEAEKPGTIKEPVGKKFNFGMNTTFKFGISPQTHEPAKPVETKDVSDTNKKNEESETNNNIQSKTPTFTFGVPIKKQDDLICFTKRLEEKSDGAPKINFNFGVVKPVATAAPVFGSFTTTSDGPQKNIAGEEKLQEVPKVDFTISKPQEPLKPATNLLALPITSHTAENNAATPLLGATITATATPLTSTLTLASVTTTADSTPTPTFTFSIKPSSNMFGTAALPATSVNISFASPLQAPATTGAALSFASPLHVAPASSTPLFQKPTEPTATSTVSLFHNSKSANSNPAALLFRKPESATTTAAIPSFITSTPLFSFGNSTDMTAKTEKPKFSFTFENNNKNETRTPFKPTFGARTEIKFTLGGGNSVGPGNGLPGNTLGGGNGLSASNTLDGGNGLSAGNTLGGGNGLPAANALVGGNGLTTANPLGGNIVRSNPLGKGIEAVNNQLSGTNGLQTGGMFGSGVKKDSIWSSPNNTGNLFVSNTLSNTVQKPAAFTFGSSPPAQPFGVSSIPAFGSNAQSPPVFGMSTQNANNAPSLFPAPTQNASVPSVFGSAPTPALSLFGTPSVGVAPTFGTPNQSIPSFEAPCLTPAQAPAFNFGASSQSSGVFGFGQQQQQSPVSAVYNFGGPAATPQFNIGNPGVGNPGAPARRMRKAFRRNR